MMETIKPCYHSKAGRCLLNNTYCDGIVIGCIMHTHSIIYMSTNNKTTIKGEVIK